MESFHEKISNITINNARRTIHMIAKLDRDLSIVLLERIFNQIDRIA
jgi:hypothetical protein